MHYYTNYYKCPTCGETWTDEDDTMLRKMTCSCGTVCKPFDSNFVNDDEYTNDEN